MDITKFRQKGIVLLCSLLLLASMEISAQVLNTPFDANFGNRVGMVDEFFARFNGKELAPYLETGGEDDRRMDLLSLLNMAMFKSRQDPLYMQASGLIDTILENDVRLSQADVSWWARAKCQVLIEGRKTQLVVWLNREDRGSDMSKWVIARVEGQALKMDPSSTSGQLMLLPNDHETNFISLHRMTTDSPEQALLFARKDFVIDETSVFFTLVSKGLLKIESVSELQFEFLQVPGYRFTLSYFQRDKANSGWLISDFGKMTDEEKDTFISKMHKQ